VQFALSPVTPSSGFWGMLALHIHRYVTVTYLVLSALETGRILVGWRKPLAFQCFAEMWRRHVRR